MDIFDKKRLTERDICTKFITPAIVETAGWNRDTQIREELSLTKGRIQVRGKLYSRGKQKRADSPDDHHADFDELLAEHELILRELAETQNRLKNELLRALEATAGGLVA